MACSRSKLTNGFLNRVNLWPNPSSSHEERTECEVYFKKINLANISTVPDTKSNKGTYIYPKQAYSKVFEITNVDARFKIVLK